MTPKMVVIGTALALGRHGRAEAPGQAMTCIRWPGGRP